MESYPDPSKLNRRNPIHADTVQVIRSKQAYTPFVVAIFLLVVVLSALPLFDLPIMGISISAPLFMFIVIQVFVKAPDRWFSNYSQWIILLGTIGFAFLISLLANSMSSSDRSIRLSNIIGLVRYCYWFLVMLVTAHFVTREDLGKRVAQILSYSAVILGIIRLSDAITRGTIGAGKDYYFLTQNSYGMLFSILVPILIVQTIFGKHKFIHFLMLLTTIIAVIVNGSRSSWVAILGSLVIIILYLIICKTHLSRLFSMLLLSVLLLFVLYLFLNLTMSEELEWIIGRADSFTSLANDESILIRQLMIQKGLFLFEAHPVFGVGIGNFRMANVIIDIPDQLRESVGSLSQFSAHNSYVQILAEVGIIGTIPMAIMLLTLIIRGFVATRILLNKEAYWYLGIYASFVAMTIHLWSIAGIGNTIVWIVYGLVISAIKMSKLQS